MGAAGVILAAAAAHVASNAGLDSAAYMLLFHATALLGGIALQRQGLVLKAMAFVALAGWALGGALFSGDIALRALAGHRLFVMAAPIGGTILIGAWLAFAVAAVGGFVRR